MDENLNQKKNERQSQFDAYYETSILPALKELEKLRRKYLKVFVFISFGVLLWLGFSFYNIKNSFKQPNTQDFSTYGLLTCLAILLAFLPLFKYYRKTKESLLPLIAGFFGSFSYACRTSLPEDLLKKSLIVQKYDRIMADDCFSGEYAGVPVSFAEYISYQKCYRQTNGRKYEFYKKNRRGIFFSAQMNKNFAGQTVVVKDKGFFNKLTRYKNLKRAGLESVEFEKLYEVYTDNQIEARYILTAVMLEYMISLKKTFQKIEFSFFDQHVFINIETKKDLFECNSFFRSLVNKKRIGKNFEELSLLFSIIDTLKLNEKKLL